MNEYNDLFNEVTKQVKERHEEYYARYHQGENLASSWGIPYSISKTSQRLAVILNDNGTDDARAVDALYEYFNANSDLKIKH